MGRIKGIFRRIFFGKRKNVNYQRVNYKWAIKDLERENRRLNSVVKQLMAHLKYTEFGNVVMTEKEANAYQKKGIWPPVG